MSADNEARLHMYPECGNGGRYHGYSRRLFCLVYLTQLAVSMTMCRWRKVDVCVDVCIYLRVQVFICTDSSIKSRCTFVAENMQGVTEKGIFDFLF